MMVRCGVCATDNPQSSRFCGSCGSALGARCPACAAPIVHGFRFCGGCGGALAATRAREVRKTVTVLFAVYPGITLLRLNV